MTLWSFWTAEFGVVALTRKVFIVTATLGPILDTATRFISVAI